MKVQSCDRKFEMSTNLRRHSMNNPPPPFNIQISATKNERSGGRLSSLGCLKLVGKQGLGQS